MKTLWENAQEDAKINCPTKMPETIMDLREIYCDGYCSGVWAAIEALKNLPEYKDATEHIKFKIGIDYENC